MIDTPIGAGVIFIVGEIMGWKEVGLIALVVLLLFGAKRIPELMRSLGQGIREFKKGTKELSMDEEAEQPQKKPAASKAAEQDNSQQKTA